MDFVGRYDIANDTDIARDIRLQFSLPLEKATYENVSLSIGEQTEGLDVNQGCGFRRIIHLSANASAQIEIRYRTRGMTTWTYALAGQQGQIKRLDLDVDTNFTNIVFPGRNDRPDRHHCINPDPGDTHARLEPGFCQGLRTSENQTENFYETGARYGICCAIRYRVLFYSGTKLALGDF